MIDAASSDMPEAVNGELGINDIDQSGQMVYKNEKQKNKCKCNMYIIASTTFILWAIM